MFGSSQGNHSHDSFTGYNQTQQPPPHQQQLLSFPANSSAADIYLSDQVLLKQQPLLGGTSPSEQNLNQMATGQFNPNSSKDAHFPSTSNLEQQTLPSDTQSQTSGYNMKKAKAPMRAKTPPKKVYTELYVWGNDQFGQLGLGHKYLKQQVRDLDSIHQPEQRKILENPKSCSFSIQIKEVACGEDFAFLLTKKGLLYAMGSNQFGKLGILSQQNLQSGKPGHVNINQDLIPQIQQNQGNRNNGQQNQQEDIPFASTPKLVECLAKHSIAKVSCGLNHAVAITRDSGLAYSWGCGSHGQLGRVSGNTLNLNPPSIVSYFVTRSMKVVDVAAGGKHTLFMTDSNQVLGVGMNDFGQLGRGDYQPRQQKNTEPVEVVRLRGTPVQITCGLVHSQILLSNGKVVSFGDNQFGQLGLGPGVSEHSTGMPAEIPSLSNIKAIACNHHSAAIGARGELYFWGTGVFGTFFEPKIVVDADIIEVSVGGSFGIAKDKDGLLWAWGQNSNGELGLNDQKTRLYPHPILTLKRKQITRAVCGGSFAVAIGPDKTPGTVSPDKRHKSSQPTSPPKQTTPTIFKMPSQQFKEQGGNLDQPLMSIMSQDLENVKIFSARDQLSVETMPNNNNLNSNPEVLSYLNNQSSAHFGSLHSQSQIFVKEAKHIGPPSHSSKKKRVSESRSQSRSNTASTKLSKDNLRRSISPILATQQSQQSFISSTRAGGAVQPPRKRKVTGSKSRSKSRTSRTTPLNNFVPIRSRQPTSATMTSQKSKNTLASGNTFEMAQTTKAQESVERLHSANSFGMGQNSSSQQVSMDITNNNKQSQSVKTNPSAQFYQEQTQMSDARIAVLEAQLEQMQHENIKINGVVKQQKEAMVQMRQNMIAGEPGKVMSEFTEEVQKAHDLEHLLRCKERTIEILRGDVEESRQLKQQVEGDMTKVAAQNQQLLAQNENLHDENSRFKEALEHAINTCSQLKSQRNEYSDRFGVLSNEMNTLRELANDIKSHQAHKSAYNSQNFTKARTSLDHNIDAIIANPGSTKTANAPPNLAYSTVGKAAAVERGVEGRGEPSLVYNQMPNIRLVNVISNKPQGREVHHQTLTNQSESILTSDQRININWRQPETTKNDESKQVVLMQEEPDQSFSPSEIVFSHEGKQQHQENSQITTPISKVNHEPPVEAAMQFTIRDLVPRPDEQHAQNPDQTAATFEQPHPVQASIDNSGAHYISTHTDNKDDSINISVFKDSRRRASGAVSRKKSTSVPRAKRTSSKENKPDCPRVTRKNSTSTYNTASKAIRTTTTSSRERCSATKAGKVAKKVRSTSTGKSAKATSSVQTIVSDPSIILLNNNAQSPKNNEVPRDSSVKQINLTVQSINKLAEIVSQEHQLLQSSVNYGYDPAQGIQYTANQNQADHSVLLRSPPVQHGKNDKVNQILDQSSPQNQFQASSTHNNNPMLTLSGHDIQGHPVEDHQESAATQNQQHQERLSVESLDGKRNNNNYQQENPILLCESQFSTKPIIASGTQTNHYYVGEVSNPFSQPTSVSQSVARMQKAGLSLNRRPELAAALRDSNRADSAQKDRGNVFDRAQDESYRQQSPIDLGPPFRKSQLVNRSASLNGDKTTVARKKETIDNFKSKLSRLEQNKTDLENKMKLFDAKVNAHAKVKSVESDLETL